MVVVVVLTDPFRGMGAWRNSTETEQSGHATRSGPEVNDGRSNAKDGALLERLGCVIIQEEVNQILQRVSEGLQEEFSFEGPDRPVATNRLEYSAIGIALVFCIKKVFYELSVGMGVGRGGKGGPWPANVFFNKHAYCKNNPTLANHRISLLR